MAKKYKLIVESPTIDKQKLYELAPEKLVYRRDMKGRLWGFWFDSEAEKEKASRAIGAAFPAAQITDPDAKKKPTEKKSNASV